QIVAPRHAPLQRAKRAPGRAFVRRRRIVWALPGITSLHRSSGARDRPQRIRPSLEVTSPGPDTVTWIRAWGGRSAGGGAGGLTPTSVGASTTIAQRSSP